MTREPIHLTTDVLIVGAGGAGMYAAIAAAHGFAVATRDGIAFRAAGVRVIDPLSVQD